jgi:hypothetical protein
MCVSGIDSICSIVHVSRRRHAAKSDGQPSESAMRIRAAASRSPPRAPDSTMGLGVVFSACIHTKSFPKEPMVVRRQYLSEHVGVLGEARAENRRHEPSAQPLWPHLSPLERV